MSAAIDLVGQMAPLRVRLDREIDRRKPCHQNIAVIRPGKPPHAEALHCETCDAFRGWLRREALTFIESLAQHWGAPTEPLILRDTTIGDHTMATKQQYDNSGILFRNEDKDPNNEKDRDYGGEATIAGVAYWISGWIKQGKRGRFMTFSFKPKEEPKAASTKSVAGADFSDEIPF
jgi:hypothetical protein